MIKETLLVAVLTAASGGGIYFAKQGFDGRYVQTVELEMIADEIYIRQDVYSSTEDRKRKWELQDEIDDIQGEADYEERILKPYETQRINELNSKIRRLE